MAIVSEAPLEGGSYEIVMVCIRLFRCDISIQHFGGTVLASDRWDPRHATLPSSYAWPAFFVRFA